MDMNGLETGENEILCGIRKSRIRPMSFQGWKKHRAGGVDLVGRLFNCQHFEPKYGLCIPACEMETSAILQSNYAYIWVHCTYTILKSAHAYKLIVTRVKLIAVYILTSIEMNRVCWKMVKVLEASTVM